MSRDPSRSRTARGVSRLLAAVCGVLVALSVGLGCGGQRDVGEPDAAPPVTDIADAARDVHDAAALDGPPGRDAPHDAPPPRDLDAALDGVAPRDVTDTVGEVSDSASTSDVASDVLPLPPVTPTVSVGYEHACAVRADGTAWCWGRVRCGALGHDVSGREEVEPTPVQPTPAEPLDWVSISAGQATTCGIDRRGGLWCWGCDHLGEDTSHHVPFAVEPGTTWTHVSAGTGNGCAIRTDGRLFCWGKNSDGEVGDGTREERRQLTEVHGGGQWRDVSVATVSACAIRDDGGLFCWGVNAKGQAGRGPGEDVLVPTRVRPGSTWRRVTASMGRACGVRTDGTLWCWGGGVYGDLEPALRQFGSDDDWTSVALGDGLTYGVYITCALKEDGSAWCWGQPPVGDGTYRAAEEPVRVVGEQRWLSLSAGQYRACGVREDGEILCWGRNVEGALGLGEPQPAVGDFLQVRHPQGLPWRPYEPAFERDGAACAIDRDGALWCWGGQSRSLPYPDGWPGWFVPWPVRLGADSDWISVSFPQMNPVEQRCGIREGDRLQCLGDQEFLADGWVAVIAEYNSVCALDTTGCAHCWGRWLYDDPDPEYPQDAWVVREFPGIELGCGLRTLTRAFDGICGVTDDGRVDCAVAVATDPFTLEVTHHEPLAGSNWVAVTVGFRHACALDGDHVLWCVGDNRSGQLGVGAELAWSEDPVRVGASADLRFRSAHTGGDGTCAVTEQGELWCWGDYVYGALDGSGGVHWVPTRFGTDSDWDTVTVNAVAICATKTNGELWCWGDNTAGLLGNEGNWFRAAPAPVAFPAPAR